LQAPIPIEHGVPKTAHCGTLISIVQKPLRCWAFAYTTVMIWTPSSPIDGEILYVVVKGLAIVVPGTGLRLPNVPMLVILRLPPPILVPMSGCVSCVPRSTLYTPPPVQLGGGAEVSSMMKSSIASLLIGPLYDSITMLTANFWPDRPLAVFHVNVQPVGVSMSVGRAPPGIDAGMVGVSVSAGVPNRQCTGTPSGSTAGMAMVRMPPV
jgi:hypothetical protein